MNSKEIDAFYTKDAIAKRFVDKINEITPLERYGCTLEPSAGSGNILLHLPKNNRLGLDLHPNHDEVLLQDFFDYEHDSTLGSTIVIGNPPFGRQSKMAVEFFNKCAEFADVIAFIIPRSWLKYRTQRRLHKDFGLYYTAILPDKAFTLDGKEHLVRCCAQVWAKKHIGSKWTYPNSFESWNNKITQEMLNDIDAYSAKHGCYEERETQ